MKYRFYKFYGGRLISLWYGDTLYEGMKRTNTDDGPVWVSSEINGEWVKACLDSSDITFGTGRP